MAKSVDLSGGVTSISKSRKNLGKRLAKKALEPKIERHGICSACGQESKSCSVGTEHHGCKGFFQSTFNRNGLDRLVLALNQTHMIRADGRLFASSAFRGLPGIWTKPEEIAQSRHEHNEAAYAKLDRLVVIEIENHKPVFKNGWGYPLIWDSDTNTFHKIGPVPEGELRTAFNTYWSISHHPQALI